MRDFTGPLTEAVLRVTVPAFNVDRTVVLRVEGATVAPLLSALGEFQMKLTEQDAIVSQAHDHWDHILLHA